MSARTVRFIANGIITVFSLVLIIGRLVFCSPSSYYWLWGVPALLISVLDIYFLTRSMLHQPKDIDTGLGTFLISVSGSMGFSLSALFMGCPILDLPFGSVIRQAGSIIAVIPYPFIFWALFCLRDCLTVVPEAHSVVARGIYKFSRHPLYMCYIVWALANMMMFPSWPMFCVSSALIITLILRLKREETLLLATFPEYQTYYRRTGLVCGMRLKCLLGG
jgi:protein-S-isoprenylcysteine O-methyltransferase Ste14